MFTRILFWVGLAGFVWAFVGYPAAMILLARLKKDEPAAPPREASPPVSVVLAVRNEAERLPARVENLLESDYEPDDLEVVIVCNGCTDGSEEVAHALADANARVRAFVSPADEGKPGALNLGVDKATGPVVVFADARQRFLPDTITRLVDVLADPEVGAASGRLIIQKADDPAISGVRRYWELETALRTAESQTGSVVGVTGAVYAIERDLYQPLPPETVLDDVLVPMRVSFQGKHVKYVTSAVAMDTPSETGSRELRRKVRTLAGNLQLLRLEPRLNRPSTNPLFWRFLSHKLMRVAAPWFGATAVTAGLLLPNTVEWLLAMAMVLVVVLGVVGTVLPIGALAVPAGFVLLNAAALMAFFRQRESSHRLWGTPVASSDGAGPDVGRGSRRLGRYWSMAGLALLLACGLVPRMWDLGRLGFYGDEELTAAVSHSIATTGQAQVPSGMGYRRALPYNWANAQVLRWSGVNDEASNRWVSAVTGALTPSALFLVGRWFVGGPAAFGAGVLLSFSEWHLSFSRMARMYSPFLLFFVIACGTLWRWGLTGRRVWLLVGVATSLLASTLHLFGAFAAVFPFLAVTLPGAAVVSPMLGILVGTALAAFAWVYDAFYVSTPYREFVFEPLELPGGIPVDTGVTVATALPLIWVAFLVASIVALLLADREDLPGGGNWSGRLWRAVFGASITAAIVLLALGHLWGAAVLLVMAMLYFPGAGIRVAQGHRGLWCGLLIVAAGWAGWSVWHQGLREGILAVVRFPFPYPLVVTRSFPVAGILAAGFVLFTLLGRMLPGDRAAKAAILGALLPLTAVGVKAAYAPLRYLFPGYPFFLLCAGAGGVLLAREIWVRAVGTKPPAVLWLLFGLVIGGSGVVSGHGIPQAAEIVGLDYGDPLDIPVHMFPTRPDHAGAGAFVRSRLSDSDVVVAEDPLEQHWYIGRVDYWLRSPADAGPFLYKGEEGQLRDIYVASRLLEEPQMLLDSVQASGRTLWVVTSAETIDRPTYYLTGDQREFLDAVMLNGAEVYRGRDGVTNVYCLNCPRRLAENVGADP